MADSKLTSWKSMGWPCDWRNVKEAKGTILLKIVWNLPRYARNAAYFSGEIYQGGGPLYQGFKDYCRAVKDYFYQSAKDADASNKPNLLKCLTSITNSL
jgi:hypothetical protein